MFDFFKLRNSVQDLGSQLQTIRTGIQTTLQQIEDVFTAPAHPDDIMAAATKWITDKEKIYHTMFHERVFSVFSRSAAMFDDDQFAAKELQYSKVSFDASDMAFIGIVGAKRFLDLFQEHIDKMAPDSYGHRNAERGEVLDKLQKKLEKLRAEEAKIVNGAAEAGLNIA